MIHLISFMPEILSCESCIRKIFTSCIVRAVALGPAHFIVNNESTLIVIVSEGGGWIADGDRFVKLVLVALQPETMYLS